MKLKKMKITGFRSVREINEFLLDDKVNILIGANDHGKTNILEAIRALNDDRPITDDDKYWDLPADLKPRIEWHFVLDTENIESFRYDPSSLMEQVTEEVFVAEASVTPSEEPIAIIPPDPTPSSEPPPLLPQNDRNEVVYFREGIGSAVKVLNVPIPIAVDKTPHLLALRPRVELFDPAAVSSNLVDRVNRTQLDEPQFEFMKGIFLLAGIWDYRDSIFSWSDANLKLLDEASSQLTDVLTRQWNQGVELRWMLKHAGIQTEGDHIEIAIQDPTITRRYVKPSLRSSGFRTYFLISMVVRARTHGATGKFIYLFDEPGTYLHPAAQIDLQRVFEKISDDTQIAYSTHSIFLINKNYPRRNRVVKKTRGGTVIDQKPFQKNWKSAREALGILASNNFLIAEKTLLVEGPSDIVYILDIMKRLKSTRESDIDLNGLSIVDAGTQDNMVALAKLMVSEGRDVVALVDGDTSGERTKMRLEKACREQIKNKNLVIRPLPVNKSIEDIFVDLGSLREAVTNAAADVIANEKRELQEGISIEQEVLKIAESTEKTLGRILDETTKTWFTDGDKLSKLSIALQYDELVKDRELTINPVAAKLVNLLKSDLALRGEREAESGIFEMTD